MSDTCLFYFIKPSGYEFILWKIVLLCLSEYDTTALLVVLICVCLELKLPNHPTLQNIYILNFEDWLIYI